MYVFVAQHRAAVQHLKAILAQLVEHLIRNQAVGGSNPLDGSTKKGLVSLGHKPFVSLHIGSFNILLPNAISYRMFVLKKERR